MQLFHASLGGGITGIETVISIVNKINKKQIQNKIFKQKKIKFAIIDKDPENIPGGVAYGFNKSLYGYFNNPIRLSPSKFTAWALKDSNKLKLINYLNRYGGYTGKEWIKKNYKTLFSSKKKILQELYLPRVLMNYWMQEKLISTIKKIKINNDFVQIKFFKGQVIDIIKNKNKLYELVFKDNLCEELNYKITNNEFQKLKFNTKKKINKRLISQNLNIGLGLPPPKQIASFKAQENNDYIWDFYDNGSTAYLIKKILLKSQIKKKLIIYFVGYKAGLLEALPELVKIIVKNNLKIKIICSSKELQSIQKAELSSTKKKYKPVVFKKKELFKIDTAEKLYTSIKKEFKLSFNKNHNNYDAWTYILSNNIIHSIIKNFNFFEKKNYDDYFHGKIRGITRFTYPETIIARELMFRKKILEAKKESVRLIDLVKGNLVVTTVNQKKVIKKYICDIVVNVSGPLNAEKIKNEIPLINKIKKKGAKTVSGGLLVNNFFEVEGLKNVYVPGILARGFNPERKTVINAVLNNSNLVADSISTNMIKKFY